MPSQPSYNYHFDLDDIAAAVTCLEAHGFCVIRQVIDTEFVEDLKASVIQVIDPDGTLPLASNKYCTNFIEESPTFCRLLDHSTFMSIYHAVLKTEDLTVHRTAAILRTGGPVPGHPLERFVARLDERVTGGGLSSSLGGERSELALFVIELYEASAAIGGTLRKAGLLAETGSAV